jgi:hypothetical protein
VFEHTTRGPNFHRNLPSHYRVKRANSRRDWYDTRLGRALRYKSRALIDLALAHSYRHSTAPSPSRCLRIRSENTRPSIGCRCRGSTGSGRLPTLATAAQLRLAVPRRERSAGHGSSPQATAEKNGSQRAAGEPPPALRAAADARPRPAHASGLNPNLRRLSGPLPIAGSACLMRASVSPASGSQQAADAFMGALAAARRNPSGFRAAADALGSASSRKRAASDARLGQLTGSGPLAIGRAGSACAADAQLGLVGSGPLSRFMRSRCRSARDRRRCHARPRLGTGGLR